MNYNTLQYTSRYCVMLYLAFPYFVISYHVNSCTIWVSQERGVGNTGSHGLQLCGSCLATLGHLPALPAWRAARTAAEGRFIQTDRFRGFRKCTSIARTIHIEKPHNSNRDLQIYIYIYTYISVHRNVSCLYMYVYLCLYTGTDADRSISTHIYVDVHVSVYENNCS